MLWCATLSSSPSFFMSQVRLLEVSDSKIVGLLQSAYSGTFWPCLQVNSLPWLSSSQSVELLVVSGATTFLSLPLLSPLLFHASFSRPSDFHARLHGEDMLVFSSWMTEPRVISVRPTTIFSGSDEVTVVGENLSSKDVVGFSLIHTHTHSLSSLSTPQDCKHLTACCVF